MLFLAPIHGYTDYIFRNAYVRHFGGIDIAVTPFVSLVQGKRVKLTHLRDLLPQHNQLLPTIPQLMGNEAGQFVVMANDLYQMGYTSVNWNLGCPIHAIARKRRGSGLLPHPGTIEKIIEKVLQKSRVKLSVKVRLGYSDENEIDRLIPVLNHFPLEYIMIHPRIGTQQYDGTVRLDKLKEITGSLRWPVVYSGDINSVQNYNNLVKQFPEILHVMLGRGLLKNLFLPSEIKGSAPHGEVIKKSVLYNFIADLTSGLELKMARERNILNKSKEYWFNFSNMFVESTAIFERIKVIDNLAGLKKSIEEVFQKEPLKNQ